MEINPEHSLEGLVLTLKLQDFGHLMRTADSLEKSLMPWTWTYANFGRWWRTGKPGVLHSLSCAHCLALPSEMNPGPQMMGDFCISI